MKFSTIIAGLFLSILVSTQATAMPMNVTDASGQLIGATNVSVEGTLYDVSFLNGSCMGLFTGCDEQDDFVFNNVPEATATGQALLSQVFTMAFDTNPALTFGCEIANFCQILIPYTAQQDVAFLVFVINSAVEGMDGAGAAGIAVSGDITDSQSVVYARFTQAVIAETNTDASVPLPGTAILLGFGLAGLSLSRRGGKS